jgi:Flp pilus assembly protein TadB
LGGDSVWRVSVYEDVTVVTPRSEKPENRASKRMSGEAQKERTKEEKRREERREGVQKELREDWRGNNQTAHI